MSAAVFVGATLAVTAATAQAAATPAGYEVVLHNSAGHLAMVRNGVSSDLGWNMALSASPAVTSLADGSTVIAYERPGEFFTKYFTADGSSQFSNEVMISGTTPGIAYDPWNHTQTVFHAAAGIRLETNQDASDPLGGLVALSTSTSIAINLATGLTKTVWTGSDGYLWEFRNGVASRVGVGLGIASGTSPAAAAGTLDSEVAWNGAGGDLTIYRTSDASVNDTGEAIAAGTSPSIAALSNGGFVTAYVSGGTLHVLGVTGFSVDTGLAVAPSTNPSIAADSSGGWEIAFSDNNHHAATYSSTGQTVHTVAVMKAGTSPAITALTVISTSCHLTMYKPAGSPPSTFIGQVDCDMKPADHIQRVDYYGDDFFDSSLIGYMPGPGQTTGITSFRVAMIGTAIWNEDTPFQDDEISAEVTVVRPDGSTYSVTTNEVSGDFS